MTDEYDPHDQPPETLAEFDAWLKSRQPEEPICDFERFAMPPEVADCIDAVQSIANGDGATRDADSDEAVRKDMAIIAQAVFGIFEWGSSQGVRLEDAHEKLEATQKGVQMTQMQLRSSQAELKATQKELRKSQAELKVTLIQQSEELRASQAELEAILIQQSGKSRLFARNVWMHSEKLRGQSGEQILATLEDLYEKKGWAMLGNRQAVNKAIREFRTDIGWTP